MNRRHVVTATVVFAASSLAAGCSTPTDDQLATSEAAATPSEPTNKFALAGTCSRLFKRHESVRPIDLEQGVIRWGCGDVPGVTDPDLGQEYCEYQAVQGGRIVKKPSDLTTGPVTCVFTSVFKGAGQGEHLRPQMADEQNLGAPAASEAIVQMQHRFNTRSAAIDLINACSSRGAESSMAPRARIAACYQAYEAGGPGAERLKELCKNTLTEAGWAEAQQLGAKLFAPGEAGYETQRDIAACMSVTGAGVSWRNSDPMICSRVARTAGECSCRFNSIPTSIVGLPFTGWIDDQIPSSCRLAVVDGAPYPYIALCTLSDQEVSDLPLDPQYSRAIANYCHDRFGKDLVMKLPLRALQKEGSCNETAGFCSEYMGTDAESTLVSKPGDDILDGSTRL